MNVAAIDMGTNSVRLLIINERGQELVRRMQITRLGQGVDHSGALSEEAIARTLAVLESFRAELDCLHVSRVRATATSAARDASNSSLFFDSVEAVLGHRPELISGDEEALLSFQGATKNLASDIPPPFLIIDIGGGSTEFALGTDRPEQLVSVPMGCVRMTERHFKSDPPTTDEIATCVRDVQRVLRQQVLPAIDVQRARTVLGLAGTISSFAHMNLNLTQYDGKRTQHSRLSLARTTELQQQLLSQDAAGRRKLLAEPKRAEVIVGGAVVLVTIMRELSIDSMLVSESDILDGLAASLR